MTDDQLIIWAAGFFDGEGCVNISVSERRYIRRSGKRVERTYYGVHAVIVQREREPLELLHNKFGGHLFPYEIKGNVYYRWHVWADTAVKFYEAIRPFSVLKRERIRLAVECQLFKTEMNALYRFGGYPESVHNKIESFYLRLKDLNKKLVNPDNPNPKLSGAKKGGADYFTHSTKKGDLPAVQ